MGSSRQSSGQLGPVYIEQVFVDWATAGGEGGITASEDHGEWVGDHSLRVRRNLQSLHEQVFDVDRSHMPRPGRVYRIYRIYT